MNNERIGSTGRPLNVAVVGSGPSGFYAANGLLRSDLAVRIDIYDRLPTPYGLVRGGVAPDHQKIKNVVKQYKKIASQPNVRFFGNVMLGRDIQVEDLHQCYDHIVYAFGNESDRKMGVEGEALAGVYSATEFVGWYNGHPDFMDRSFNLAEARRVAVVGNGNVAIDVARVLARHPDELAATDIASVALDRLHTSQVEEVLLLGRRGPAQSAFSPSEIKEIGSLESADLELDPSDMELDPITTLWLETSADRDAHKNMAYMKEKSAEGAGQNTRKVRCKFLVSPTEFIGENGRLTGIRLIKNELYASNDGTPRPRATETTWVEPVDLVFKAIGYRGVKVAGVPFHEKWGTVPNVDGRVTEYESDIPLKGQYVVGWAKRGPTGLIGTNKGDSEATVSAMLEDVEQLNSSGGHPKTLGNAEALLRDRKIDYISFADWELLDEDELRRGSENNKIREKYTDVNDMIATIKRLRS